MPGEIYNNIIIVDKFFLIKNFKLEQEHFDSDFPSVFELSQAAKCKLEDPYISTSSLMDCL